MSTTTNLITLKAIVLSQWNDTERKYRFKRVLYADTDFKAYPGIIFHLMTEDCLARRPKFGKTGKINKAQYNAMKLLELVLHIKEQL